MDTRIVVLLSIMVMTGCTSQRSISYHPGNENWSYRGELSQMEVIAALSAAEAAKADQAVTLPTSGRLILIQSGQALPDPQAIAALPPGIEVLPFSGIPAPSSAGVGWRQAARAGDVQTVVVYWGTIETSRVDLATKVISWTPVTAWIPDEEQRMRVAVSAVVADIASGRWRLVTAASEPTQSSSSFFSRDAEDRRQIAELKREAFAKLGEVLRATGR